ncbi:MAG: ArsA family ATPase [Polyangiaceae bacterium]
MSPPSFPHTPTQGPSSRARASHGSDLGKLKFVFVTGKGGVGKTTVCAALAMKLASEGKRVLVAMCNAKERLSTLFGTAPIGPAIASVAPRVWAVNMSPEKALEEYGMLMLKSRAVYNVLFGNEYVKSFFAAIPGMHEWTMLGKAWWHTTETMPDGSPKYDVVLLDAPATGHGLDMLRVPKVLIDVVPSGLLRRDAERAWEMFQDAKQTGIVLVTLPEEMPTTESIEMSRALTGELGLHIARVVVNGHLPTLFTAEEGMRLEAIAPETPLLPLLRASAHRARRERVQSDALARIRAELAFETRILPFLFDTPTRPADLQKLAEHL